MWAVSSTKSISLMRALRTFFFALKRAKPVVVGAFIRNPFGDVACYSEGSQCFLKGLSFVVDESCTLSRCDLSNLNYLVRTKLLSTSVNLFGLFVTLIYCAATVLRSNGCRLLWYR